MTHIVSVSVINGKLFRKKNLYGKFLQLTKFQTPVKIKKLNQDRNTLHNKNCYQIEIFG